MNATTDDARHTLPPIVLSRPGPYRNGDVVSATWTLRNFGDAETNGARVRFDLDPGLTVELERSKISGSPEAPIDEAFNTRDAYRQHMPPGIALRDLAPGAAITVTFAVRIGMKTTTDSLAIQATLMTAENEQFTSAKTNIKMRLSPRIVVATPEIFTIKGNNQHFGLRLEIVNEGGVSESGVRVHIPIPGGVDVAPPLVPAGASFAFDERAHAVDVVLGEIAPYSKAEFGLQFQANENLVGDIVQIADCTVNSDSSGMFHLDSVIAKLERAVDFSQSALTIEPGPYVEAGAVIEVALHLHNQGRSVGQDVAVAIALPDSLIYASGSLSINGAPDARRDDPASISIPVVRAHTTTIIRLNALVKSPAENESRFTVTAKIDDTLDAVPYEFAVRSRANFPAEENYVWIDAPLTIEPQTTRTVLVKVMNTGTDVSRQVRLRIDSPEITLTGANISSYGEDKPANIIPIRGSTARASSAIDLGIVGPQEERIVAVSIIAPETFNHEARFPLTCYLRHDGQPEAEIGSLAFVGRSFPRISEEQSYIKSNRVDDLRIGQTRNLSLYLKNVGSDAAINASVDLDLPSGLTVEKVSGATMTADGNVLFHPIPAQASSEATVTLRVVDISAGDSLVEIHPSVTGERINTIHLAPLALTTTSQSFLDEVLVEANAIEQDAALMVHLRFKNIGDGAANAVVVHSESLAGYASSTTAYNSQLLRDIKGQSPLAYGLALPPVGPGETVDIVFAVNPKSEEAYIPKFYVESEDQGAFECQGTPYRPALKHRFIQGFLDADTTARIHLPSEFQPRRLELKSADVADAEYREATQIDESVHEESPQHSPPSHTQYINDAEDVAFVEANVANVDDDQAQDKAIRHFNETQAETSTTAATVSDDEEEEILFSDRPEPRLATTSTNGASVSAKSPLRFGATFKLQGPHAVLVLDQARVDKIKSTVDLLFKQTKLGWYRHVFAMRLFAPDRLLGVDPDVEQAWEAILDGINKDFSIPLMRLVMPSFEPSIEWAAMLAKDDAEPALETIMQAMPSLISAEAIYQTPRLDDNEIVGRIKSGSFDFFDEAAKASVHQLNAVLPALIPDTSTKWPNLGEAFREYRDLIAEKFASVAYMADDRRHDRMLSAPIEDMDDALRHVQLVIENEVQ